MPSSSNHAQYSVVILNIDVKWHVSRRALLTAGNSAFDSALYLDTQEEGSERMEKGADSINKSRSKVAMLRSAD